MANGYSCAEVWALVVNSTAKDKVFKLNQQGQIVRVCGKEDIAIEAIQRLQGLKERHEQRLME